jgi:hypothetical protein
MGALLQINVPDPGQPVYTNARAEDKFRSATDSSRVGTADPYDPTIVTGYTGTQIFTTYAASTDPNEPEHCNVPTCATYWFSYLAPNTGLLTVDNSGTTFDALLAIYSGPDTNYANLIPVACSHGHGIGLETATFDVVQGSNYWIVLGSVTQPNGGCPSGTCHLNYNLIVAPSFTTLPVSQTRTNGVSITLTAAATGTPALGYQWLYNGVPILNATNTSYTVINLQGFNEGLYSVLVTNSGGANYFNAATVFLNSPLEFINTTKLNGSFFSQLLCVVNTNYIIQVSTNLTTWTPVRTNSSPIGIITFTNPIITSGATQFFRAKRF